MTRPEQAADRTHAAVEHGIDGPGTHEHAEAAGPASADQAPPATSPAASTAGTQLRSLGSRYALLGVWAAMIVFYSALMPDTFFGQATLQAVLGSQSALLFLAVAALCTFVVGEFDLSFAGVMGLTATIIPVLATQQGVSLPLSCLIGLAVAVLCGCVNALFIVKLGVPSLIVTLGTASLFLGLSQLISDAAIVSVSDPNLSRIAVYRVMGLPLSFYYGLALCLGFTYLLAWTPLGRHIIFVGANREVARLAGVNVNRIRAGSYIAASLIAGLAGILLVATVGGFDPTASGVYLLPAFAGVFLGTAVVQPGQFNPMGTWIGIYFLATGILGLQLLGYSGWVQDTFYGAGLIAAVTVASIVRNRTSRA